jgi:hypothetical protein
VVYSSFINVSPEFVDHSGVKNGRVALLMKPDIVLLEIERNNLPALLPAYPARESVFAFEGSKRTAENSHSQTCVGNGAANSIDYSRNDRSSPVAKDRGMIPRACLAAAAEAMSSGGQLSPWWQAKSAQMIGQQMTTLESWKRIWLQCPLGRTSCYGFSERITFQYLSFPLE